MRNKKKTKHTKPTDEIKKLAGINWSQLWEKRCPAVGVDKLMTIERKFLNSTFRSLQAPLQTYTVKRGQ